MTKKLLLCTLALLIATIAFFATQGESAVKDTIVLTESNTISLNKMITGTTGSDIQAQLINHSFHKGPIYLVLNSPGGDIEAGQRIIETAKGLPQAVHTISLFSASMSFMISQYLSMRYVLNYSTLMGHRAKVSGMEGEIPGNLLSRTLATLAMITELESGVANRAGMKLENYRFLTADEMWLEGQQAVDMKFADKVVNVRCDHTLNGPGATESVDMLFFKVKVTYHKCPLITDPMSMEIDQPSKDATAESLHESKEAVMQMFYDKPSFVRNYIETGKYKALAR